jgi:hypothetical protein
MNVHRATCSCSVQLNMLRYTLADFLPAGKFRGGFSKYHYFVVRISEAAMCGEHYIYIWVPRSSFIRDGEIEDGEIEEGVCG